jgi:hypothetical protein
LELAEPSFSFAVHGVGSEVDVVVGPAASIILGCLHRSVAEAFCDSQLYSTNPEQRRLLGRLRGIGTRHEGDVSNVAEVLLTESLVDFIRNRNRRRLDVVDVVTTLHPLDILLAVLLHDLDFVKVRTVAMLPATQLLPNHGTSTKNVLRVIATVEVPAHVPDAEHAQSLTVRIARLDFE